MEFKLISLKKKNIIQRFFEFENYTAIIEYNDKEYKFSVKVFKDDDVYSILRSIKRKLEKKLAEDSFDLTLEDIKEYEGKVITKEDYGY